MNLMTMVSIGLLIYNVGLKRGATAADVQLAQLVKAGKLTQAEADALKRQSVTQGTDLATLIANVVPGGI